MERPKSAIPHKGKSKDVIEKRCGGGIFAQIQKSNIVTFSLPSDFIGYNDFMVKSMKDYFNSIKQ